MRHFHCGLFLHEPSMSTINDTTISSAEKKAARRSGFFLRRDPAFVLLRVQFSPEVLPNAITKFFNLFPTIEPLQRINLALTLITFNAKVPAYMDCFGQLHVQADESIITVGAAFFDPARNQRISNGGQLFTRVELTHNGTLIWSGVMPVYSQFYPRSYPNLDRKLERRRVKTVSPRISSPQSVSIIPLPLSLVAETGKASVAKSYSSIDSEYPDSNSADSFADGVLF